MRKELRRWIDLHENQGITTLSEDGLFPGGMAASSPWGEFDDPEVRGWQRIAHLTSAPTSLAEFKRRFDFARQRLVRILNTTESLLRKPKLKCDVLSPLMSELSAAFSEFCSLRGVPLAWQDIQTGDAELISRATTALLEIGIREKASNAENDT